MSRRLREELGRACRIGVCGCDHDTRRVCPFRPLEADGCWCSECRPIMELSVRCTACGGCGRQAGVDGPEWCDECGTLGRATLVPGYAADGTPTGTWAEIPFYQRPFRRLVVAIIHDQGLEPWVRSATLRDDRADVVTRIYGGRTWPRLAAELRRLADVLGQRWAPRGDR